MTRGYRLPATWVIHTVGPVWRGGEAGEAEQLAACYRSSLACAAERGAESVALPAISTGAYGYPLEQATEIAVRETAAFLAANELPRTVTFVCFSDRAARAYEAALAQLDARPG